MDDKELLKRLGLKLKILRNLKNLSQDDIADKLNIDKSYYSKLERGLANPTFLYLKHLSDIFEVNITEIVDSNISF